MLMRTSFGEVAYEVRGQGPPMLLLCANGHDRHAFDAVMPELARRFRTVAVDWPGMGESPALTTTTPASAPMMADLIEELVAGLALGPAVIIGNSIGGFAALRLAARRPELVRALVVVNSGGFSPVNWFTRAFCWLKGQRWFTRLCGRAFAAAYLKQRNPHVADILARIDAARRRDDYLAVETAIWRNFPRPDNDVRAEAARVRCPTLLVWGRHDPVIRARVEGKIAQRAMPHASYVEIDSGHVPFAEAPEAFLGAALPFLAAALPLQDAALPLQDAALPLPVSRTPS
ncbi:MAG: alpha/beta fold hydrolase [Myxococcales bacterium]|nr:alpha/beta fold hydrolase [Myxococcales bacterium]